MILSHKNMMTKGWEQKASRSYKVGGNEFTSFNEHKPTELEEIFSWRFKELFLKLNLGMLGAGGTVQ